MKRLKRLTIIFFLALFGAVAIGLGSHNWKGFEVQKGFVFGPPIAQQKMEFIGWYVISRWGFPATYREVQKFQATDGATYETSYVSKPFNLLLAVTNVVLLMSFLVALLAPVTIFWRPKKKQSEVKLTEKKTASQVKDDANTRD